MQERKRLIYHILLSVLAGVAVTGCLVLLFNTISANFEERHTETHYIESAVTTNGVSGSFTIGCGSVHSDEYYVVYVLTDDGGKQLKKYDTDITTVYDNLTDSEKPYVEITKDGTNRTVSIKLYVPENSITQEFNLNLSQLNN